MGLVGVNRSWSWQIPFSLIASTLFSGVALACSPPTESEFDDPWGPESEIFIAEIIGVEGYTDDIDRLCLSTSYDVQQVFWGREHVELSVITCSDGPRPDLDPDEVARIYSDETNAEAGFVIGAEYLVRLSRDDDQPGCLHYASSHTWPFHIRLDTLESGERSDVLSRLRDLADGYRSTSE